MKVAARGVGLSLILSVVIIWVLSSELIQFIFDDVGVNKPLFLTFYSTSLFSVYLIGFIVCPSWRRGGDGGDGDYEDEDEDEDEDKDTIGSAHDPLGGRRVRSEVSALEEMLDAEEGGVQDLAAIRSKALNKMKKERMLPVRDVAVKALIFSPAWIAANWAFNASLCISCGSGTSVSSNTVISSTSSGFTLMLSAVLLHEKLTATKVACVCISMAGVILVTTADGAGGGKKPHSPGPGGSSSSGLNFTQVPLGADAGGHPPFSVPPGGGTTPVPVTPIVNHVIGDVLSLVAALMFAIYSVLIKWLIPSEKNVRMPMFFGFTGVFSAIICVPILAVLHFTGVEEFDGLPSRVILYLTLNGMFGTVLSDLLWAKAIVLTSPLTVNLGTSLTIPLSCLADSLLGIAPKMPWEYVVGAMMVIGSFFMVNLAEFWRSDPDEDGGEASDVGGISGSSLAGEGEKDELLGVRTLRGRFGLDDDLGDLDLWDEGGAAANGGNAGLFVGDLRARGAANGPASRGGVAAALEIDSSKGAERQ